MYGCGGLWRAMARATRHRCAFGRMMCRMNDFGFFQRLRFAGKIITRGVAAVDDMPAEIMPPSRTAAYDPLQLSTVFRGVQVLQTAIAGLPLHEMRGGVKLTALTSIIE